MRRFCVKQLCVGGGGVGHFCLVISNVFEYKPRVQKVTDVCTTDKYNKREPRENIILTGLALYKTLELFDANY